MYTATARTKSLDWHGMIFLSSCSKVLARAASLMALFPAEETNHLVLIQQVTNINGPPTMS